MKYLIVAAMIGASFLMACSSAPDPVSDPEPVHETIEWNELAWHLPASTRVLYMRQYGDAASDPAHDYATATRFDAPWDSLGIDEFTALPGTDRQWRRQAADELVHEAFLAVADRAYRMRYDAKVLSGQTGAGHHLDLVLARALSRLHTAAGTDPTNVGGWYHLAYFSAVVGDEPTAALARKRLFDLTTPPDPRRPRLLLDEAWVLRDSGRYQAAILWLDGHTAEFTADHSTEHELAPAMEADLVRALCAAEQGDRAVAQRWITGLPTIEVESGLRRLENNFLRTWVHAWAELRSGYPDLAAFHMGYERPARLPAGVGWRYWQDLGLICEELGDPEMAGRFWSLACIQRPYMGFYPQTPLNGTDRILGQTATGEPYFLGYRRFFTVGSLWGFATTRALTCQLHDDAANPDLWDQTFTALDACVRREIHAAEARLLRARLNLQRGDWAAAEIDLSHGVVAELAGSDTEADLQFLRGVAALNAGRLGDSIEELQRCVELEPHHARGWQSLAIAACYLGNEDDALAAFARVEQITPEDGTNYFNRGLLHLHHGRYEEAEADFLCAARLLPDNSRAVKMLQSVARGREVKVDMSPQPVQLVASDEELARAASLDRLIQGRELDPQLLEMFSGSDEEQALWLELLERRYEDEPTSGHRRQLAEARAHAGDHHGVAALLSPGWPERLSPRERALLLDADRSNGTPDRAGAIADEDVPADLLDVPVLIRATTILLDHGRVESARQVLTRAQALAPDEPALDDLAARLP